MTQASFVAGVARRATAPAAGGSASVPFDTMLVFQAGSTLKLQNASLFVQNQGSALQSLGTAAEPGDVHLVQRRQRRAAPPTTTPTRRRMPATGAASSSATTTRPSPPAAVSKFPVDGTLVGPQWRRGHLRRPGRHVDPQLHRHPLRRRGGAAGLEQLLQRHHAVQLPADDHQ